MPSEDPTPIPSASIIAHRREHIANTSGDDLKLPGLTIRLANVPLFRASPEGLLQAVRVRAESDHPTDDLTVTLSTGNDSSHELTLPPNPIETGFLLVPEVSASTPHKLTVHREGILLHEGSFTVEPQRKWTIHLVHHSHYDIGYTDPQSIVLHEQLAYIDTAIELASHTADWPDPVQFRWSIEVTWPLKHWLRTRPASSRQELVRLVKAGNIEINALPFSMHTEAYSFDELARQLEFVAELRNDLGVDITTAMQTDVPGANIGLATLLTDAGIKLLSVAHNYAGRSIPHLLDGQDLTRPFYWQAPNGERLMVWYTDSLNGSAYMEAIQIGFGDGYEEVLLSLPEYLNALSQRNYPYGRGDTWIQGSVHNIEEKRPGYPHDLLHLRVQGAHGDNAPATLLPATIAREWNETWAWPQLVTSTNARFYAEAESRLGDRLETFTGDWTDWWADGIGSSAAMLATNRDTQANIRTAQVTTALASALETEPGPAIEADVRAAYEDMALFDEHTWGAGNPWTADLERFDSGERQWIRKASFALSAEERTNLLLQGGIHRLEKVFSSASSATDTSSILALNPNSWSRTDLVRMLVPPYVWPGPGARLVETGSGESIHFVVEPQQHDRHRSHGVWITFLARDVPPLGYIRYTLEPGTETAHDALQSSNPSTTISSQHLQVELDLVRGAIGSITDRGNQRELVDQNAPFPFNAYIHDRYASGQGFNHLSSRIGHSEPWLLGARGTGHYGHIISSESNDVFERATMRFSAQGTEFVETTVTLPHGAPRLHIANRLRKPSTMEKESVYFAFPIAGADPRWTFEITGGTAGPDSPHVPGSAQHFRAMRHWATIETNENSPIAWATRQAPLIQLGNIHLPYAPFATTIPAHLASPNTLYSWALNNIWDTNFPAQQGGELRFDYTLAVGGFDHCGALGRDTGASAAQPLVGLRTRGTAAGDTADRGSFIEIDDPTVEITHLSTGPDQELVIHLHSHAIEARNIRLKAHLARIASASIALSIGDPYADLDIQGDTIAASIRPGELGRVFLTLA
jgi:hypothetical protein